jgi:hypothetical protein
MARESTKNPCVGGSIPSLAIALRPPQIPQLYLNCTYTTVARGRHGTCRLAAISGRGRSLLLEDRRVTLVIDHAAVATHQVAMP